MYFDCVSPYAYFAFETLEAYKSLWNIDVQYQPVSLGAIMKVSKNRPPISVPNKGIWMKKDIIRTVEEMGLGKVSSPPNFPYNSIKAQRMLQAIKLGEEDSTFIKCSRAMWTAGWIDHKEMTDDQVLIEYLSKHMSKDKAQKYVAQAEDQAIKEKLVAHTNLCLEAGAFGNPWIRAEKDGQVEWYWGNDRFNHLTRFMGLEWRGLDYCQQAQKARL